MALATEPDLATLRVLVVEDDYFIADDMARALRSVGAELLGTVPTGEVALALLSSEPRIDIAVLDINLRGQPVFPVAEQLRARNIPFVFATGYDEAAVPPAFSDVPHWEKPFDAHALARMLPGFLS